MDGQNINAEKEKNVKSLDVKRAHSSLKCWLGAHRYEVLEKIVIKNKHDEESKHIYISRCVECGKIKRDEIPCEI